MSFNDFLHRCEMLDFDFDPKMVSQGRMHTRDIAKLKVCLMGYAISVTCFPSLACSTGAALLYTSVAVWAVSWGVEGSVEVHV